MRDALMLELHRDALDPEAIEITPKDGRRSKIPTVKKLRLVARALVDAAIEKDISACKEINDRVDGKVILGHELSGRDGGPIETREAGTSARDIIASRILSLAAKIAAEDGAEKDKR